MLLVVVVIIVMFLFARFVVVRAFRFDSRALTRDFYIDVCVIDVSVCEC